MRPLNPTDLKPRGYFSADYQVVLDTAVTLEDALEPEFWRHINSHNPPRLRRFDRIQIIPEDGSFVADLIVLATGKGFAKLAVLNKVVLECDSDEPIELRSTEVKWRGPALKYVVERKSDNNRLKTGFDTRGEAEVAARDYERVTA